MLYIYYYNTFILSYYNVYLNILHQRHTTPVKLHEQDGVTTANFHRTNLEWVSLNGNESSLDNESYIMGLE